MSVKPKIVHLTSVHGRYDQRIFRKECRSLVLLGYDVALIAADGKSDEVSDGVNITAVASASSRVERLVKILWRMFKKAKNAQGDLYQVHDPELLIVALMLKFCGKKVIFDMHEDAAVQIGIKPYLNPFQQRVFSLLYGSFEGFAIRRIAGFVAATDGLVSKYAHLNSHRAAVQNYVDTSLFPSRSLNFDNAVIFHPGALNRVRGLDNMVALAERLPHGSELLLAGNLEKGYSAEGLRPAQYLGVLGEKEIKEIYERSNIGVILYNAVGQYGGATAVKAYEYMAASMPIIMPDHGDWPAFNREIKCGLNVRVNDPESVARAVAWILENPEAAKQLGENGREYVLRNYSWVSSLGRLKQLYDEILNYKASS